MPAKKVFLDANILISAGKPPGGLLVDRLIDLVRTRLIEVLTTDLTMAEIAKKHVENDLTVIKEISRSHFRSLTKEFTGVKLPDIKKAELRSRILEKHKAGVAEMFNRLGAKVIPIDDVSPSVVFGAYTDGTGFFGGEGKRDQFPDAFIYEALKSKATEQAPLIIVTADGDFDSPTQEEDHISTVASVPDLFSTLGLEFEAPEMGAFLEANIAYLNRLALLQLQDTSLEALDVDDAEIEVDSIAEMEFDEIAAFRATGTGTILVLASVELEVAVSFVHPDWDSAIWDSEDRRPVPIHEVTGSTQVTVESKCTISIEVDGTGAPVRIVGFEFEDDGYRLVNLTQDEYYG